MDKSTEHFIGVLYGFAKAYPVDIFPPLTQDEVDQYSTIISKASAGMGRHLGKFMHDAATEIERLAIEATALRQQVALRDQRIAELQQELKDKGG